MGSRGNVGGGGCQGRGGTDVPCLAVLVRGAPSV